MNFKIIAIRPLDGCHTNVLNNLSVNQFYFFSNNYKPTVDNNYVEKIENKSLPKNFFYNPIVNSKSSLEFINIQAIVGKNGEGKSSLVELLIRILNNFFKEYSNASFSSNLIFAQGVHSDLFFEKDNKIFKLTVDSRKILSIKGSFNIGIQFYEEEKLKYDSTRKNKKNDEINDLRDFFFNMYINYSIYGLDSKEYKIENEYIKDDVFEFENYGRDSWLTRIFHKNDGYQTPIVIHPFRSQGQINVRNEKYLMEQRLLSLIFQANKPFFVTDDLTVNNMTLSLKENVFLSFIKEYIEESKNVDQFHHVESSLAKSFNTDEYEVIEKKINEYYDFLRNNLSLLTIFHQMFYELEIDNHSSKSDLRKINLILFSQYFANPKFPIDDEDYYNILDRITDDEASDYNDEIMLKIRYILNHTEKFSYRTYNLFQIFTIYYNFWANHFKLRNYFEDEFYANNLQVNLFHYCIIKSYKTIKYPQYKNSNSENINTIESFSHGFKLDERIYSLHSGFLEDLIKDQSHISLKLRQCIVLLRLCLDNKKNKLVSFYSKYFEGKKDLDVTILNNLIDEISLKYDIERVLLLPPRIFDLEIYLKSQITNDGDILIRKISSGEYQKNAVISSVIYHLKNLDSVNFRSSDLVNPESIYNFEDINIIFDEIELYFHPDFQRTFIKELISRLKDVEFTKIKSINFLFITHSPFILSDIPKVNVLFLKKGKPDFPMQEDTFGANIHTLLQHGFFLNAVPIGDFAKDKINEIFSRLHNGKITDEFGEDLLKSIMLVSEPFIKTQLLKHYNELNPDIKALKEQVDFLTKELLQIKKDNDKN
ncbi:hypothetical protein NK356_18960 [Chryseobacterium sp. S0630]|uniref:hypothetical protein n=1 Tax=Chryseobacterium sp. S0630 TaxID=2957803 RepID=UPI00209FD138|nr:hypothetical protein [Chryseobacterium sp. S0630]MCP1301263.1 hypothetical protein [Chryseobacterium sp. S0630]